MRRNQYLRLMFMIASIICFALGWGAKLLYSNMGYTFWEKMGVYSLNVAFVIMIFVLVEWLFSHRIYKGIRYFLQHVIVLNSLELQMIDAGLYIVFCTRFCENETNIKVIQEIMGHSDISTTMNIYAEATESKKKESFENLEGKIKIS